MALPELVRMRKFDDSRIVAGAERLFREGTFDQKLAAAVFLAPGRSDCAEHAIERLLTIEPGAVSPLIRSLDRRLPGLASILENIVAGSTPAGASLEEREALDRRRARAATVLILIGQGETGWQLLRFKPDPQARSFLVHDLGPSGVDPETILNRIAAEREPSSGHALILALGEVPDGRWSAASRKRVSDRLLEIYRGDPNRGVHGSAKWYLKRWKPEEEMHAVDVELAKRHEANPPAEWRVSKSLLTFVTIPDPERGRVFEILDTEVTRKVFGRFRSEHRHDQANSPELDSPANSITYHDAAGFCEWLNREEHFSESYRHIDDPKIGPKFEPLPGYLDRTGYRLVTLEESMLACKAGTTTRRYFGESNALLASYARSFAPGRTRMYPVASLKPNDYGVFDLLGNAIEIGQSTRNPIDPTSQALLYGGSTKDDPSKLAWDYRIDGLGMSQRSFASYFGFRIARTLSGMLSRPIRQPPSGQ
jgi:formylglycine-generating enzyme required for sulfatase activity